MPRGVVETKSGRKVPQLQLTPDMFLDKTTLLYGPSKTGKSVWVKHIMKMLRGSIDQVIVVSPTELSNETYKGYVPGPMIHTSFEGGGAPPGSSTEKQVEAFLAPIWRRQQMATSVYNLASDPRILRRLFNRLPPELRQQTEAQLQALESSTNKAVRQIRRQSLNAVQAEGKTEEVEALHRRAQINFYKRAILKDYERLWRQPGLGRQERTALSNICTNPRILLIFDDCASDIKKALKSEAVRRIFYQGRHQYITTILCCQDDSDVTPELRKNAFVSVFTSQNVCTTYFGRAANGFSRDFKARVGEIAEAVYVQGSFRRVVYLRDSANGDGLYHAEAKLESKFMFGSEAFLELCRRVEASHELNIDTENPFYSDFHCADMFRGGPSQ